MGDGIKGIDKESWDSLLEAEQKALDELLVATKREAWDVAHIRIEGGHVVVLKLERNQLSSLPDAIGTLKALQGLNLSNNQLTNLPKVIGNLENLEELDASNNKLVNLPDTFVNLVHLNDLDLSNNQLTSLPDAFGTLESLVNLDLSNNQFSNIKELGHLPLLTTLFLNKNRLTSLPDGIGDFNSLDELDLSHNHLASLPGRFGNLQDLERLNLAYNRFDSIPDIIGKLHSIRHLNLCGISVQEFKGFGNAEQIILSDCPALKQIAGMDTKGFIDTKLDDDGKTKFIVKDVRFFLGKLDYLQPLLLKPDDIELYLVSDDTDIPLFLTLDTTEKKLYRADRKNNLLEFKVKVKPPAENFFSKLDYLSIKASSVRGDEKEFIFKIPEANKISENPGVYESNTVQWKIDPEFKYDPTIGIFIYGMEIHQKNPKDEIPLGLKVKGVNKVICQFSIALGGGWGRFFDNVIAKLVFINIISSGAGFIASKVGLFDLTWSVWIENIGYVIIFVSVITVIIMYLHESRNRKKKMVHIDQQGPKIQFKIKNESRGKD
jgi:hypothetical protein